jgi:hypothetical protein
LFLIQDDDGCFCHHREGRKFRSGKSRRPHATPFVWTDDLGPLLLELLLLPFKGLWRRRFLEEKFVKNVCFWGSVLWAFFSIVSWERLLENPFSVLCGLLWIYLNPNWFSEHFRCCCCCCCSCATSGVFLSHVLWRAGTKNRRWVGRLLGLLLHNQRLCNIP